MIVAGPKLSGWPPDLISLSGKIFLYYGLVFIAYLNQCVFLSVHYFKLIKHINQIFTG